MASAFRAFVPRDPVVPVAVGHQGNPASRASGVPLVPFRQPGLLEPGPFPFPPLRFRGKQGKRGGDLIVRHGRNGGLVQHKKSLPTVGRRLGGRVIAKQPGPGRLPTVSDCLAG